MVMLGSLNEDNLLKKNDCSNALKESDFLFFIYATYIMCTKYISKEFSVF